MNDETINNEWNISFDGGFFENHSKKRGGKEIKINKSIPWGEETVHIPAVYVCSKGLIVDILIETDCKKVWDYINKYNLLNDEYAEKLTAEQREELENESPLLFDMKANLTLNGKKLKREGGSGCSWIPNMQEEVQPRDEAVEILEHYGMDMTKAWSIRRLKYGWVTVTKPKLGKLMLDIKQGEIPLTAGYFENPNVGDEVKLTNPADGTEYIITVKDIEQQSLKGLNFPKNEYDYPTEITEMTYSVSPEISADKFRIFDCIEADKPKLSKKKDTEPAENGAVSVGIIGGNDGPIAVLTTSKKPEGLKTAISSMHFHKVYPTKWRMVFYTKTREDISLKLI